MREFMNVLETYAAEAPKSGEEVDPSFLDEINPDNVWFHGTNSKDFKLGWEGTGSRGDMNGRGFYLTNSQEYARKFSDGSPLIRVKVLDTMCMYENGLYGAQMKRHAIKNGCDSVLRHVGEDVWEIVMYNPNNVRII